VTGDIDRDYLDCLARDSVKTTHEPQAFNLHK
jgi:hypothetical protein